MPQENNNINQNIVEGIGNYLFYSEMALNDRKEFNKRLDEYERVRTSIMPSPPLDWNENVASIDGFCEISTKVITKGKLKFKPLIIGASKEEIKSHLLKYSIWEKPLICGGPINVLAAVFNELAEKFAIRNGDRIHERVHKHFINSFQKTISAHHLAVALSKGLGPNPKIMFETIMSNTLKRPTVGL
jgi:hypothetical protein